MQAACDAQQIKVLFSSNVRQIEQDSVVVVQGDQVLSVKNDAVIVSAGGILPTDFLKKMGINVETKYGTA